MLAEQRLKESIIHTRLLNLQLKKAQGDLEKADLDVGQVRSTLRKSGYSVLPEKYHEHGGEGLLIFIVMFTAF